MMEEQKFILEVTEQTKNLNIELKFFAILEMIEVVNKFKSRRFKVKTTSFISTNSNLLAVLIF